MKQFSERVQEWRPEILIIRPINFWVNASCSEQDPYTLKMRQQSKLIYALKMIS